MDDTATTSEPTTDREQIAELHRRWVSAFDRSEGDPRFDFRSRFGELYDFDATDLRLYDDFDPERRVATSAAEYGAIWEPAFQTVRHSRHVITDGPHVLTGDGSLAASTLVFTARVNLADGTVIEFRSTSSLVWRRTGDGWRIVREHNSTDLLPEGALDPV
jgi:ketosteroid isomerase-like protein